MTTYIYLKQKQLYQDQLHSCFSAAQVYELEIETPELRIVVSGLYCCV